MKDKDQDIVYEDAYLVASSSILTRMFWSGTGDGSGSAVA
jgi:hypothetical protein